MIIPVIEDKICISSNIQKLLHKKVNVFYQDKSMNMQKATFIIPSYNELLQIKLPFLKKIKIVLIALSLILLYFTKIFRIASKNKMINKNKIVLVFSLTKNQIFKDASLHKVQNFLTSKRFNITRKDDIIIECRKVWRTKNYSNLTVTLDIPLRIFARSTSLKQQIRLLIIFSRKLIVLIKSFNNSQYIYLVFKEYIFDENVYLSIKNKNQVSKIITGPGNLKYQPIIFEISKFTGERIMLWYSANSIPEKYKSKKATIIANDGHEIFLKPLKIDIHWVWTNEHKKYLMKMTDSKILVKGSMLFYNPPKKPNYKKKYDIVIFDLTPKNNESMYEDTLYTFPVAKKFIEDIIESAKLVTQKIDKDISIYLKHKRAFHKTHSLQYITYVGELAKNGQLSRLPLNVDLYEIIAASKMIICFPFTSSAIIARELKVPSIYYSSNNILAKYNKTNFIQDKFELRKFIETNLGK
jgi:polysaccharide biosynthesis PFTS motif protein